jgi:hypothetical protein
VRANLAGIGIDVQIKQFPDPFAAAREPDANIDLLGLGTDLYYADSASFLEQMLLQQMPRSWLPNGVAGQVERLSRLDGVELRSATVALADRLATKEVPVAAAATPVVPVLLGPRLGCRVFPPWAFGIDLAALCLEPTA